MNPQQQQEVNVALEAFWASRSEAADRQAAIGGADPGARAGVTSGGHLDHIAELLAKVCLDAGAPLDKIYYKAPKGDRVVPADRRSGNRLKAGYTLPGFNRPTKDWDVVVYHARIPIVAIELKSQIGPSYGNNANNRAEEALGNAVDLADAHAAGLVAGMPWTGYVFVVEDDISSRRRTKDRTGLDEAFKNWSYISRVQVLCRRLQDRGRYDAAWAVATSRDSCPGKKCPQMRMLGTRNAGCPDVPYLAQKSIDKLSQEALAQRAAICCQHWHEFSWTELDAENIGYAKFVDALSRHIKKYYG